jgi:hypothetical protein
VSRSPSHFPLTPFPTPRLPQLGSPAFARYYEVSKTPARISEHSVCHVAPDTLGWLRWFAPGGRKADRRKARMLLSRCHPLRRFFPRTRSGLPGSQRTPLCLCPALGSRSDLGASPRCGALVWPPLTPRRRLRRCSPFETQSHGFGIHCLRFVPPSRTTTQDSLPGVASLFRVGLVTHWVLSSSFGCASPAPGLLLARGVRTSGLFRISGLRISGLRPTLAGVCFPAGLTQPWGQRASGHDSVDPYLWVLCSLRLNELPSPG